MRRRFPAVRVGWEKPEKLHLTLKFLGDTDDEQLAKLTEAAEKAAREISVFKLRIAGTGVFPNQRKARVLWLGVEEDEKGSLRKLNEALEKECERHGFTRETRGFKAHLTIARLREPEKSKNLIEAHLQEEFAAVEFEVADLVIYQSRLSPQGSQYAVVSKHTLGSDR
ncbi:MAG: RNA 2',3'-cyclic phosphodiesterase [Acidobacteriota bacterium]|nr:RNA 2',3'-cyclic phosphodiesterase [Acidobacteriota bacterium]